MRKCQHAGQAEPGPPLHERMPARGSAGGCLGVVEDEWRVRQAAMVEAALALDHRPRANDAGLHNLEVAMSALWRMPLLNADKDPIWRL
ncbi:hypothetical protein FOA52_009597 [Chlamydomonas sp. UWO 241]|nr:hypothetical protein FOA52_009597 [Chlamydomonas sp. UWO 241]